MPLTDEHEIAAASHAAGDSHVIGADQLISAASSI
jgi:hypothetical protein